MNSWLSLPPIAPESASTGTAGTSARAKMRAYASNMAWYDSSSVSQSGSKL